MQIEKRLEDFLVEDVGAAAPPGKYTVLSGTELSHFLPGRHRLCFADIGDDGMLPHKLSRMPLGPTLSGGVFRNSFYLAHWLDYTSVRRLSLLLSGRGRIALVVAQSVAHAAPSMVVAQEVDLGDGAPVLVRLPNLDSYTPGARLYWDIRALTPDAEVGRIEFVTDQPPTSRARLAVLIRTFGRTHDVVNLLGKLSSQVVTEDHRDFLATTKFIVLDTTADALRHYRGLLDEASLNLAVFDGENLGGGGNAAQVLFRFLNSEGSRHFDDLIMTDDDLEITLESLCRYRAFVKFRSKDVVTTCPILMKSDPEFVWEDGGFWGRFHPSNMTPERVSIFPRLLKHGWRLKNFDHLDDFGKPNKVEYATFIFFAGPVSLFRKIGYPTAFFLRGDDIEYSLRLADAGYELISNPNVCAWHEPGHSYGAEYMAILHGIIVNMRYGVVARDLFVRFFNSRLQAHSSIRDGLGLRVYIEVLRTLTGSYPVLTEGFDAMYRRALGELKALETGYEKLARPLVDDLLADRKRRVVAVPFLDMRAGDYDDADLIILENHPSKTFYFRSMRDEKLDRFFYENLRIYLDLFGDFIARFDEIAAEMSRRLAATQSPAFWDPFFAGKPFTLHTCLRREGATEPLEQALPLRLPGDERSAAEGRTKTLLLGVLRRVSLAKSQERLPDGFDEDTYLWLNPDVAKAAMSARTHYLKHGKGEGRPWRLEGSA